MSHTNNNNRAAALRHYQSTASLCESDAEALSQECAIENASQYSLSSDEEGEEEGYDNNNNNQMYDHEDMPPPRNVNVKAVDAIPVPVVDPIPSDVLQFAQMANQHPQLSSDIRKFRTKWKKHHDTHLLTNPSAQTANDKADQLRMEFTTLVNLVGTPELQSQWSTLTTEGCDKFLVHLFLPPELGGFLETYNE